MYLNDFKVEYDEFGPEKNLEVYDSKTGMWGVTVVHNTARGRGKGGIRLCQIFQHPKFMV